MQHIPSRQQARSVLAPATLALSLIVALAAGCAGPERTDRPDGSAAQAAASAGLAAGSARSEVLFAVTAGHRLVSFNAGQPGRMLSRKPITGLHEGETVLGIDYRVNRGVLYALARSGDTARLLTIDTATGHATPVGQGRLSVPLDGNAFGFDFNPTVDRIRVVSDSGQNLRLHPDTGAVVDADTARKGVQLDAPLAYVPDGAPRTAPASIVAAAYTYNKKDETITTNYAIDRAAGTLVIQGSLEGTRPAVSPNTGRLSTVGPLGLPPFRHAQFDIADISNAAFVAITGAGGGQSTLHLVDLATGRTTPLGRIGGGEAIIGLSFEP